jgi:UDP-N-acetyl-2-amino-2-deoxyglucuronate dehydrogenase
MPHKIKFCVVGLGHIGKRHIDVILSNQQAELVSICDLIKPQHSTNIPWFQTLKEFLNVGIECDVVVIATPNGLHEIQSLEALEAGKHIVIEKPMALTKEGCERIIFKALSKSKQVFCVMQNRYSPISIWLKNIIDTKLLGEIYMVQINCFWNRDARYYKEGMWQGTKSMDGGVIFTQFAHFVDLLYWCFGDLINIESRMKNQAHQHNTEFDDSGIVSFELKSGGIGSFQFSTAVWDKNMESSVTIIGAKGSIKVGGQYMEKVDYCHIDGQPNLLDTLELKANSNNHRQVISNVIDVLNGKTAINTNALEGMKVIEIIERMYGMKAGGFK